LYEFLNIFTFIFYCIILKNKDTKNFLKLSWIKNYTRIIPNDVIAIKESFDKKNVFDNYVILHFDKMGDSSQMTEKEKEKAKDPILFGVSKLSRKLFYVADWTDEYCDLTLDKFLEKIEMDNARELTRDSIKNELNR
jgi:hypothetical protein